MRRKGEAIGIIILFVTGGLVAILNFGSLNAKGTNVSGLQYDGSGGPWTTAGSPYIVIGNVTVPMGQTLTIDPSVQVRFDGSYGLYVDGDLRAMGSAMNKIIVTSNKASPKAGDWSAIQINSTGRIEIKYSYLSYAAVGINLHSSSNNNITNNILSNNNYGISLVSSSNNNITNNNLTYNFDGIYLSSSSYNEITNNDVSRNNGNGIYLYESSNNNTLINNEVSSNSETGIYFLDSNNNTMTYNDISSNDNKGIYLYRSSNNTMANNNVSSNPTGIALRSSSNNNTITNNYVSPNNGYGVYLDLSSDNIIVNNILSSNGGAIYLQDWSNNNRVTNNSVVSNFNYGIYLWRSYYNVVTNNSVLLNANYGIELGHNSRNNTVANNNVSNNGVGITLEGSSYNDITSNNISPYNGYGIYFYHSYYNRMTSNYISSNPYYGIYLQGSSGNWFYHNDIMNNGNQSYDDKDNIWNDTYPSGGNYWSDYSPICEDNFNGSAIPQTTGSSDGICDDRYNIDADSIDYYPLKNPFVGPPPIDTTPPMITNLQPPDKSTTSDNTPIISADYSDVSSIDTSSVLLEVDATDVTASATVTTSGVTYTPGTALQDGLHKVTLEVRDASINNNLATVMWNFTVDTSIPDTTPPIITNLKPSPDSTTIDNTPTISADYNDTSGIDLSSVKLKIDGEDVTSSAIVKSGNVTYFPGTELLDGVHDIYLEVRDINGNLATATWNFTVEPSSSDTPPSPPADFLTDYWWILVVLAIAIIILIVILLWFWKKREKG